MLSLTRPLRQGLATLGLVAFSVAPTAFVAVRAWKINRPSHVREVEHALGKQLGLQVELRGVGYPRPGEVEYLGVVVRQEEPSRKDAPLAELARADRVVARRDGRDLSVEAVGLRLRGESPRLAMFQLGALLQRPREADVDAVLLLARRCRVDLGPGLSYELRDVAGSFRAEAQAPTLKVGYVVDVDGDAPGPRCELALVRDRSKRPFTTNLSFKTVDGPLPARVLDPFFATADWLGAAATVEGELTLAQEGAGDWSARFRGALDAVDLAKVMAKLSPDARLDGQGRLTIESARWGALPRGQGTGWVEARGAVAARRGTIGVDLLRALGKELHFRVDRRAASATEVAFAALGLGFAMTPEGEIHLSGRLGTESTPGAVLVWSDGVAPLALEPQGAASVHGLLRAFSPLARGDDVVVPVTAESRGLLRVLPVPAGPATDAGAVGN